jgi:GNAT superfamily N-acetyltransferase
MRPPNFAPSCIAVVETPDKRIIGLCILGVCGNWYTAQKHIEQFLLFIDPEFRHLGCAERLLDWAIDQSTKTNMVMIVRVPYKQSNEALRRLYERKMRKVGADFGYGFASGVTSVLLSSAA